MGKLNQFTSVIIGVLQIHQTVSLSTWKTHFETCSSKITVGFGYPVDFIFLLTLC